jgi:anion-transporting  ArsA/GET3 family ATPase
MTVQRRPTTLLDRQLHFVTGKGGVGKSVVACALATHLASSGLKTILVQVNAADSHSALLATPPIDGDIRRLDAHLSVVNIRPDAALHEYARIVLRFEAVVNALLENRVARAFLRFVPSLAELTMLGKIWYHAHESVDGAPRFDRIVVDAPSTGHGLGFLRVARVVHDATGEKGPMAEKTREMQATLTDPKRSVLHVVTLPEEMPVNETLELIAAARDDAFPRLGLVIVNAVTPVLFDGETRILAEHLLANAKRDDAVDGLTGIVDVAARRLSREAVEQREIARLDERVTGLPRVSVPVIAETRVPAQFFTAFRAAFVAALVDDGSAR